MLGLWTKYVKRRQWTNRKIAFVAVLIATSVAFVIVFTNIIAIATIPSFKLMAGGLPVKLTGYIFGPIIGGLTGVLSDLLSFAMRPSFYHYYYTIAWGIAGVIPGLFGMLMNKETNRKNNSEEEIKISNRNFFITLFVLATTFASMLVIIELLPSSAFAHSLVKSRTLFLTIALLGSASMMVAIFIFRFVLKPETLNQLLPIIAFSALLEVLSIPLLTLGDQSALFGHTDFLTNYTAHLLLSPIKIWGNMIVIMFAYRVVSPLIYNKSNNGYDAL